MSQDSQFHLLDKLTSHTNSDCAFHSSTTNGAEPEHHHLPTVPSAASALSESSWKRSTEAVRHFRSSDSEACPLGGSVYQSTTFVQEQVGSNPAFAYSRVSNPTVDQLESLLGRLEDAPPAVCFSSGLAAETALFLTLLKSGDHVVLSRSIYGGTTRLFNELLVRFGVSATFVDSTDSANVEQAITDRTALIFLETPANPTLELTDIAEVAKIAKRKGIPLAVDNTFLTPILQQPLELGADISVYSTTKHIEGHSVALGGAITSKDEQFISRLRRVRKSVGSIQTPKNAWLTIRGIKTLPLRIERHSQSALTIARWLDQHPEVITVNYPGLESHPQHALALQQHECLRGQSLHGGVISFELTGGYERAVQFSGKLQLCNLVEHIGGIETLLTHPASMTHADVTEQQLADAGITRSLLRLSVGLEDEIDILADLEQALCASRPRSCQTVVQERPLTDVQDFRLGFDPQVIACESESKEVVCPVTQ
ncbi:MAG TPA: aminotransferase class I/II-fold pyridoxal phosphate-dependent enzyme [Pirellulaceae bacterium]|mgnify:CR=1 FL=1|nr:aminotransferase class I/II-fold pyridoxal phosphate-dependent enzyme [Pirellulaceae bacterium]HMO93965.1 aminotransferase class I/II-fold pyridoxal phosphate-dependent enzyme [Pirellulaceae bacterium]HMP70823.1 aminotransferase class I/II-fold pyridoxal phosphate-dependent enzyme [Pirellulaceae bacterium]